MNSIQYRFPFEKLIVWQKSKELVKHIYRITSSFPSNEQFGLCAQMNRASISVISNIAEGTSRTSSKDQRRFSEIAYGSLMELACQVTIAEDLNFINLVDHKIVRSSIEEISRMLIALKKSQKTYSSVIKAVE
jgi:four helix bundle protein